MYRIINENYKVLFQQDIFQKHFEDYKVIMKRFQENDVSRDLVFQRKYKSFYGMRYKTREFCENYFEILERYKNSKVYLKVIVEKLFLIDNTYEFSFATKLLHTINQRKPIYDTNIDMFFNIDIRNRKKEIRHDDIEKVYEFLQYEYKIILKDGLLDEVISYLKKEHKLEDVTDEKVIDSILWGYIKFTKFNFDKGRKNITYK